MGPPARPLTSPVYRTLVVAAAVALGCRSERASSWGEPPATPAAPALDSLVLSFEDSIKVWLSVGRDAQDSLGRPCQERTVKISSPRDTILVPLLYTGRAPERFDARSIKAELWKHCAPMAIYRVDLATGRPTPLKTP